MNFRPRVTGDKTWIHHNNPETKQQSMQWKHGKFKVQASADKIMCTIFWDAESILLINYTPHKETITGAYYAHLRPLYVILASCKPETVP